MDFRQIEAFVAVAEHESFTRAGDQLHLTQSAVSQLVRRLEDEIGEALFVRNGRKVKATRAGDDLLPAALEMLQLRRAFGTRAAAPPEQVGGALRVGTSSAATAFLWAQTFQAFAQTYPKVELDVRSTQQTMKTLDDLLAGELDVGILPFPVAHPRLVGHVVGHQEALLVAAPSHPLTARRRITAADLAAARFILYEQRMNFRALSDHCFRRLGVAPTIVLQSNDTYLIRAMTEVGFGVAFLPDWAVQRELAEGRLVALKKPGPRLTEEFGVMHLARSVNPAGRAFVAFCRENVELLPAIARGGIDAGEGSDGTGRFCDASKSLPQQSGNRRQGGSHERR